MKRSTIILGLLCTLALVPAAQQVIAAEASVTVQVGAGALAPVIIERLPDTTPILTERSGSRTIMVKSTSTGNVPMTWTASVISGGGSIAPINGTVASGVYLAFDFLAPSTTGFSQILLTLNDGQGNLTTETLTVFAF